MKNIVRTFVLAAALAGTVSTTAAAQLDAPAPPRSKTAGFNLGVFLNGSAVRVDDSDVIESGAGGSVHLGYGFTENVSVFLRVNGAAIESDDVPSGSYTMAHADIGVRYSFLGSSTAWRPFVQGAFSGRAVSIDEGNAGTLDARGPGFTAGAGLEYFVTPRVAVEAGLSYSFGEFNEGRLNGGDWVDFEDEAFEATSSRFDLGVSWHP
jgi:opacity protein-like surface antigen